MFSRSTVRFLVSSPWAASARDPEATIVARPSVIFQGADDGAEMGVFQHLQQPQRETNLRVRLNEYLRFGLEAALVYVT